MEFLKKSGIQKSQYPILIKEYSIGIDLEYSVLIGY